MFLPAEIILVLAHFAPAFTQPTYRKVVVLVVGTLLAKGRRTVTAALRIVGLGQTPGWTKYHQVLNRALWSGLAVSQRLLLLLVTTFVGVGEGVTIAVDETLERRWGPKIQQRGHWRDSLASSAHRSVSTSGLRWLVLAVVINVPWTPYALALPFLSVLLTTPKVSAKLGKRHKTVAQWTGQIVCWLRRTLAGRPLELVGDGSYAVVALGLRCRQQGVTLIAPLRLDARLFAPPPRLVAKPRGRPRVVGERLPTLATLATQATTRWQRSLVPWYAGTTTLMDWITGTALWYTTGTTPLLIRWVLVRDPAGKRPLRAFFTTDAHAPAPTISGAFVKRWSLDVTFEEGRAHLGIETQRQWSTPAIARTTPALFGLFSLVVLMAHALYPDGLIPVPQTAWYPKAHVSFHDLLALVRRRLWLHCLFQTAALSPDLRLITAAQVEQLLSAVCY
jgi:hypothetical protein